MNFPQTTSSPDAQTIFVSCPVCGSSKVKDLLCIEEAPVFCNILKDTYAEAVATPKAEILLSVCQDCTHIFNRSFLPELLEYNEGYENSLHFSPFFQNYAQWLAGNLIERYHLKGKRVTEIGSGKGDFLRMICQMGGNQGTGYDPSYPPGEEEQGKGATVHFIQGFFSELSPGREADLIYSRHTLEHLSNPVEFVRMVRRAIGERDQPVVFLEVPNAPLIFRALSVWDIIYEHFSYFNQSSLAKLMKENDFQICALYETFENQFLCIEASPAGCQSTPVEKFDTDRDQFLEDVQRFPEAYQKKLDSWRESLNRMRSRETKLVLWGAGSKGVMFLNLLKGETGIEYVVDINPRKIGKFIPGSGQKIVPVDFLRSYQPDAVIVMNPNYRDEIAEEIHELGLSAELIIA